MKTLLTPLILILITSCGSENSSNEMTESKTKKHEETTVVQEEETPELTSPKTLSKEDSTTFYRAIREHEQLVNEFCNCASKHGGASGDCRDFIKSMIPLEKVEDDLRNKYIYNSTVYDAMAKKIDALTEKFNHCADLK